MQTVELEHTFGVPPAALWEAVWDPRLLGWMCSRLSTLEKREVLSQTVGPDGRTTRRVRSTPRDRLPAMVKNVFSVETLAWEEEQKFYRTFRPDEPWIHFTIVPSAGLRSLFNCTGRYELSPIDGGARTLRRIHVELEVNAGMLVNRLAEGYLQREITQSLEQEALELVKFLAAHPPVAPGSPGHG